MVRLLKEFYAVMFETKSLRSKIVEKLIKNKKISLDLIQPLRDVLKSFEGACFSGSKCLLELDSDKKIQVDMTYEIQELKKDLFFLEHTPEEFYDYLSRMYPDSSEQIETGLDMLKGKKFANFISDRDGTTNNYCGRYGTSIQSAYNAFYLTCFAKRCAHKSVVLTSAPLADIGLLDVSTAPKGAFIYAGSKGREYLRDDGTRGRLEVKDDEQKKLDELNSALRVLLEDSEYEKFALIGSGLQIKYGQTTIAHQDVYNSISVSESLGFIKKVEEAVRHADPDGRYFRIEDTGMDMEVILTFNADKSSASLKDFDKGDGVNFLDDDLDLGMRAGSNLICGDTRSDLPMAAASMEKNSDTWSVFVTKDDDLKDELRKICTNSCFVSDPDILVLLLKSLSDEVAF